MMRQEGSPLDLNNLPEDYAIDGKLTSEDSSSSAAVYRKKKGAKDRARDEPGKVYECRFCYLKFCKSQALGGHMNRHRQDRETETLNKARQLVFTNDLAPGHLGYVSGGQPIPHGGTCHQAGNIVDPALPFMSMYPTRLFSTSSPLIPTPPPPAPQPRAAPYMYSSPRILSFHSQYPPSPPPVNNYFMGQALSNSSYGAIPPEGNNTCIGAQVGNEFPNSSGGGGGNGGAGVRDVSLHNRKERLDFGRR